MFNTNGLHLEWALHIIVGRNEYHLKWVLGNYCKRVARFRKPSQF